VHGQTADGIFNTAETPLLHCDLRIADERRFCGSPQRQSRRVLANPLGPEEFIRVQKQNPESTKNHQDDGAMDKCCRVSGIEELSGHALQPSFGRIRTEEAENTGRNRRLMTMNARQTVCLIYKSRDTEDSPPPISSSRVACSHLVNPQLSKFH
jgi:hypothetical protein